jgi:hydrogenase expression/formation protein HypC
MCIGIPGLIVELVDAEKQVGRVEVSGVIRTIHCSMLEAEEVQIGKWVLINAGLAIRSLAADEASQILQCIEALNRQCEETQT